MKVGLECLNKGSLVEVVNSTLINLIPKTQRAEVMIDFKPISLCIVFYEIILKTMANRLTVVLRDVSTDPQSAFIISGLISYSLGGF